MSTQIQAHLWDVTAGVHLPRKDGLALSHRVGALAWVGSGELLVPLLVPFSITMLLAGWGRVFARLGPCCPPSLLQQVFCVSDLLAAPPWADRGVFSEGEGPRGESLPCTGAVPCCPTRDGPRGARRPVNAGAEQGTMPVHEGN